MKKNRLFMILIAIMMVGLMAFAFAGCGGGETDEDTETTATEETTETTAAANVSVEDPDYDINDVLEDAGLEDALKASGVEYSINQFSNITNEVAIHSSEYDGVVGTFMAYDKGDNEYEQLPDYQIAGEKDGVVYVLMLPTDVRYDTNSSQERADYEKLTEVVKAFKIK